ncbi:hypothetical protein [Bradyrhizobium sp. NAS80.1]|uniref:hypothetical protein n=1 Tax=Bradyrhizobium sp. NAS80.1 TaxID=1680159 RepID=UPI00143DCBD4|nr:hypothetical protein [Bradyrhizobium sp. NAS80.1]
MVAYLPTQGKAALLCAFARYARLLAHSAASGLFRGEDQGIRGIVIPGRAKREPGIHRAASKAEKWIPGSRQVARPGMTVSP